MQSDKDGYCKFAADTCKLVFVIESELKKKGQREIDEGLENSLYELMEQVCIVCYSNDSLMNFTGS